MKVGILTLPIAENYGGILQSLALYLYLCDRGHDVVLIYKDTKPVMWKKIIRGLLFRIPFHNYRNIKTSDNRIEWRKRKIFHRAFIEANISDISDALYTTNELNKFAIIEDFFAVIVGSDQVWAIDKSSDIHYKNYFLDFIDSNSKTKKIAYAASYGKRKILDRHERNEITELMADFESISCREKSGVTICEDLLTNRDISHVLDPTFLIDKEIYVNKFISQSNSVESNKVSLATYILDPSDDKDEIVSKIYDYADCNEVINLKSYGKADCIYTIPQWLQEIHNAEFIITDSFHGMVFSIIFEKEFLVIGNEARGLDRFTSLLSILNLEDRMVLNGSEFISEHLAPLDYNKVNKILDREKMNSMFFLDNALKQK